jgi:molybdopterin-guanine dinucleotide biosynthesis protein A
MHRSSFSGAVLCGGESKRMGRDKATLEIDGAPMAIRVADALRAAGAVVVWAVGGDPAALAPLGIPRVADERPGAGPLAATITALRTAPTELVVVLACDWLRPTADVVQRLVAVLRDAPPTILGATPRVDGHRQWAHVAWRTSALPPLEEAYTAGTRSLRRAGAPLSIVEVTGIEPELVADADTVESLGPSLRWSQPAGE